MSGNSGETSSSYHSVHGGSRPSVTLPSRKSSSSVGVWASRPGSSGKRGIDEQPAPDGPDGVPDEQRHEQASVESLVNRTLILAHQGLRKPRREDLGIEMLSTDGRQLEPTCAR